MLPICGRASTAASTAAAGCGSGIAGAAGSAGLLVAVKPLTASPLQHLRLSPGQATNAAGKTKSDKKLTEDLVHTKSHLALVFSMCHLMSTRQTKQTLAFGGNHAPAVDESKC